MNHRLMGCDTMKQAGQGLMPDLDTWQRWEARARRGTTTLRAAKQRLRPAAPAQAQLLLPQGEARTLVVLDKLTPSCRMAAAEPLRHLDPRSTAVLVPDGADVAALPGEHPAPAVPYTGPDSLPAGLDSVLSLGAYLEWSQPLEAWARRRDIPFHLVQHGLLTPWSPPASPGAHVLAWSDADAEYWARGRSDLTLDVVGSQMLWHAAHLEPAQVTQVKPVMLGQLHGIELSRREALRTYLARCGEGAMDYRPHPNEHDVVSRALHALMRRRGVTFETSGSSLAELGRPVVSIFSTGTLEAATRGLPAWVTHPEPPAWLQEFWQRYGLHEWGSDPTPAWTMPEVEPARAVAQAVQAR